MIALGMERTEEEKSPSVYGCSCERKVWMNAKQVGQKRVFGT